MKKANGKIRSPFSVIAFHFQFVLLLRLCDAGAA